MFSSKYVQFQNKVVAITGAAGGIGQELCRYFGREGAAIAALDRNESVTAFAEQLRGEGITVESAVVDIVDAAAVAAAFAMITARLGPIDILINNAGVSRNPSLERTTPDGFRDDVNANLNGAYNCAHAVLPDMKARRAGSIVNIGSVNGLAALGDAAYSAAKAGLISLTRSLALEFGRYNIRANIVCPGTVRTPLWDERARRNPEVLDAARTLVSARPHRRADRGRARGRLPRVRRRIGYHRRGAAGRLRAIGRQHRHGAGTDAGRLLVHEVTSGQLEAHERETRVGRRTRQHGDVACPRIHADPGVRGGGRLHAPHRRQDAPGGLAGARRYANYEQALAELKPDVVSINTLPDTHADYAIKAMEAGAHVFVEKPLAETVESAEHVVAIAERTRRKLVIGYILRQHPSWIKFIDIARQLGTPLVFRMNLNQQSNGETWEWHKRLMDSFPPIVDCGVHYVDIMCQMTAARPTRVHALGAHLTDEVPVYNYGMLQVAFDDGSVGWYEAGWGPMMSETAFFVKDVIGPKGSVSIVMAETAGNVKSDDINAHTKTNQILWHHADMTKPDERIDMTDEPDHDALCEREQRYLLKAIDEDIDLSDHMNDGVKSLQDRPGGGSVGSHRHRGHPLSAVDPRALQLRACSPCGTCAADSGWRRCRRRCAPAASFQWIRRPVRNAMFASNPGFVTR